MIVLVALLIIVAVGFSVAYPLWKTKPGPKVMAAGPNDDLITQKEATYAALKELEFDYALGNLTPQDHRELEQKYKDKAVSILKRLDARENRRTKQRPVEEIETEILRLRRAARKGRPEREDIEAEIRRLRHPPSATPAKAKDVCPKCHSEIGPGAKYCPYCGSSLVPLVCPKCSAAYHQGEHFCAQCGAALPEVKEK